MKIYPDTTVYILCPARYHTGGAELLHQLCSQMIQYGINAQMFYVPIIDNPVDDFYEKYHLPYTKNIVDDKHNIFVGYEGPTHYLYKYKNIRRVLWWLSADNYLNVLHLFINEQLAQIATKPLEKFYYFQKEDSDIEHWVQSEYARQFIKLNGISDDKIYFVGDYMNQAFLSKFSSLNFSEKENWVAFNPVKGFEVTQFLMNFAPNINWKPIQNMTPAQVQELLAKCKVYIDFGNHPGKDRIPREAALSGCVVITGKRGSAANDVDVNIPPEFKFDEKTCQPDDIIRKINQVFENFNSEFYKQKDYRKRIMEDKKRFAEEVATACEIPQNIIKNVAIFDLNDTSLNIAKFLLDARKDLIPAFIVDDNFFEDEHKNLVRENNRNYFYLNGENRLEIISTEDAKFLSLEGRITHFAVFSPSQEKIQNIKTEFQISEDKILVINQKTE